MHTHTSRSLVCSALLVFAALSGCTSKTPTPPPDAPMGVSAIASDGAVTVSWEASPGATGYRVYFNAVAAGEVTNASQAVDAGTALFVQVTSLVNGTSYAFAVAARGTSGEGALSTQVNATPSVNSPLAVASTSPVDGAAEVARSTKVTVVFNKAATVTTITGQSAAGACTGSVQLSSDGFTTCAGFSGAAVASAGNTSFAFTPGALLRGATKYQLRVTTAAKDSKGTALAQQFTQATGFTTTASLVVSSVTPADGATQVPLAQTVTVAFNRALTASSVTVNGADTACTGSIQLSTGAFATNTCLKVTAAMNGNSVVLTPSAPFAPGALVQVRVTTALLDDGGAPLDAAFTSAGFTTAPPLSVASIAPADGQTGVDFLPALSVAFAAPAAAATITTNTGASTACSGSIQLSKQSSNFAANTCVPMAAAPASADGGTTFTLTPAGRLSSNTKYLLRVTTAATDKNGAPLAATYTSQGFTTRAFAVASLAPTDGTTAFARNGSIAITFNRPVNAASVGTGTCTGPFVLTKTGAAACTVLGTPSVNGAVVTIAPAAVLDTNANYKLQINTTLQDDGGGALQAFSTNAGFTTTSGLDVASTEPTDGKTGVPENAAIKVVFTAATLKSSITAQTTAGACTGAIQLSAVGQSTCLAFAGPPSTLDNKTYMLSLAANLAASTSYKLLITTAAQDANGVALTASREADFTTGTAVDTTPPAEVGSPTNAPALQSISLAWTNPSDIDFSKTRIHLCPAGVSTATCDPTKAASIAAEVNGSPSASGSAVVSGLLPSTAYNLLISTVDQSGNESAGTSVAATTAFSGVAGDFTDAQRALAVGTGGGGQPIAVWFTWNASLLYAGVGNEDGTSLLTANQDVIWIAVDTDPDSDANGEVRTPSLGNNEVIWPFHADYIVQLIPNGTSTSVQVRAAGASACALIGAPVNAAVTSGCANASGALNFDGTFAHGIDEVAIPATALGSPAKVRLAFAVLNSTNGYAYALAPANPHAIDVLGYFGSATAAFNPGSNAFDPAKAATSAQGATSPLQQASDLVTLSVQGTGSSAPTLKGSLHPLSYTLTDTAYALRDDGTGGDATAGDGIYSGAFNFGGSSQQLFFKWGAAGAPGSDEFPQNTDRVWTLSGSAEALPQVAYGVAWSATHSFQLTFEVNSPGGATMMKEVVGNVTELGNFGPGMGKALTQIGTSVTWATAAVAFTNHDFTATPLEWKARDNGDSTWENDGPAGKAQNHQMNDDVLNARLILWNWNDYGNDPF